MSGTTNLQAVKPATPKAVPLADETVTGIVGGTGVLAGVGAIVSTSCCALPIALSMAGVGGMWVRALPQFAFYRDGLVSMSALLVALGWVLALWKRRRRACAARGRSTLGLLFVSTAFLTLSLTAGWWDPQVLRLLASARLGG